LRLMNRDILNLVKKNYPDISLNDLISPKIIVIHQKRI
jgi:hypothetical protein